MSELLFETSGLTQTRQNFKQDAETIDPENSVIADGESDSGSFVQVDVESSEKGDTCEKCEECAQACTNKDVFIGGLQRQSLQNDQKIDGLNNHISVLKKRYTELERKDRLRSIERDGLGNHVQVERLDEKFTSLLEEHRLEVEKLKKENDLQDILVEELRTDVKIAQSKTDIPKMGYWTKDDEIKALERRNLELEEQLQDVRQRAEMVWILGEGAQRAEELARIDSQTIANLRGDVLTYQLGEEDLEKKIRKRDAFINRQKHVGVQIIRGLEDDTKLYQAGIADLRDTIQRRDAEIEVLNGMIETRDEALGKLWNLSGDMVSELEKQKSQNETEAHLTSQTIEGVRGDVLIWTDLARRQARFAYELLGQEGAWSGEFISLREEVSMLQGERGELQQRVERLVHHVQALEANILQKEQEIEYLRGVLRKDPDNEVYPLNQDMREQGATIRQQYQEIAALRSAIQYWNQHAYGLFVDRNTLCRVLEQRDTRISQQDEQIASLRQIIAKGDDQGAELNDLEHEVGQRETRIIQQNEKVGALTQRNEEGNSRETELVQRLNANRDVINALLDRILELEGVRSWEPASQDPAPQSTTPQDSPFRTLTLQPSTTEQYQEGLDGDEYNGEHTYAQIMGMFVSSLGSNQAPRQPVVGSITDQQRV
ncbi:uncharacterized protein PAC_18999 [Phialocephala subalpina]|uniref:Uncharacterized protein n=1 Tax=Phialocephala subalpina TaxID=576137 RepID=A0A1L7XVS4_9HELO|nr:uncharacterized protein PAC_18999 [Phialocephala subalpina]